MIWKRKVFVAMSLAAVLCAGMSCRRGEKPAATPGAKTPAGGSVQPVQPGQMATLSTHEAVAEFQKVMDAFYRHDPREELPGQINTAVDAFNDSVKARQAEFEAARQKLNAMVESLNEIKDRADKLDAQLQQQKKASMSAEEVSAYNQLVTQGNALAMEHKALGETYNRNCEALNKAMAEFEKEVDGSRNKLEEFKTSAEKRMSGYANWHNAANGLNFFSQVNALYARLCQFKKAGKKEDHMDEDLAVLRAIRRELGEWAQQTEGNKENGLIIVSAMLDDKEECHFIVDTGASVVTIPPALVDVLGLSDRLGEMVTVTLAAGITIKGPEAVIPRLTVYGKTAEQVKGVVLDPSSVGVDGLLGHSFLNQFNYHIDRTRDPKLSLELKSRL